MALMTAAPPDLSGLKGRHFLNTTEFTQAEFVALVERALALKQEQWRPSLAGAVLGMVFFNPSLRTKASLASGVAQLGGISIELSPGQNTYAFEFRDGVVMDGATQEHIREAAPVLSRYCHILGVRASELITRDASTAATGAWDAAKQDTVVRSFAKYAGVPVINLESNMYHPCQGLGDALTLKERFGQTQGRKYVLTWAYHPKALPVATPHSQFMAAVDLGMDVTLAYPEGWDLDPEVIATAQARAAQAGGSLTISHDQDAAAEGADVICAKSWGALAHYGAWEPELAQRANLKHWIVDEDLMSKTNRGVFMHCLPTRRNVEVTDGVLDSAWSIVIDEAENRMHAQNALIAALLGRA
jgi:N-acetylornithine carbamoyltransferase